MKKTITQLWNGELAPIQDFKAHSPEIKLLDDLIHQNAEKLQPYLSENSKKFFNAYNDCVTEYIVILLEQAFSAGYSLASRLLAEALTDEDAPQ